ncbi:MAG: hypothetical protein HQK58_12605 [Deltaproteobacteria bacterium]|nr:hypothetical protein [Deltaproteobacteria bacterium]
MDETVLKVAMAAFFHDMGKFADKDFLNISDDSHNTAAFIKSFSGCLPSQLSAPNWGKGDCFVDLADGHLKPESPYQWIIAMADEISGGQDGEASVTPATAAQKTPSASDYYRYLKPYRMIGSVKTFPPKCITTSIL